MASHNPQPLTQIHGQYDLPFIKQFLDQISTHSDSPSWDSVASFLPYTAQQAGWAKSRRE